MKKSVTRYLSLLDFVVAEGLSFPVPESSKTRPQKTIEYHLTLDMAKELAMVERNEKGRQTQPHYFEATFPELLDRVCQWVRGKAA